MISLLRGVVQFKQPFTIVLDVQGVGYDIHCTQQAYENAPVIGAEYQICTRLIVREDSMTLFGFASVSERALFDQVISVSGIGPRTGHTILSGVGASHLREAIRSNQIHLITSVPGVGKKTAERLVLELRDKLLKEELTTADTSEGVSVERGHVRAEALQALMALGYQRAAAEKAIRVVLRDRPQESETTERLIKAALKEALSGAT